MYSMCTSRLTRRPQGRCGMAMRTSMYACLIVAIYGAIETCEALNDIPGGHEDSSGYPWMSAQRIIADAELLVCIFNSREDVQKLA